MDSTKRYRAYSLTMMLLSLPSLATAQAQTSGTPTGAATGQAAAAPGDDAIYCRPPEQRADSRMMGPKVCMSVGKWKALRAKGLDVSADGQSYQQIQNGPGAGSMGAGYDTRPMP
jgi:hypothetical protein